MCVKIKTVSLCEGSSGYMSEFSESEILFMCLCMSQQDRGEIDMEVEAER